MFEGFPNWGLLGEEDWIHKSAPGILGDLKERCKVKGAWVQAGV